MAEEARERKPNGGDFYLSNVKDGLWETLERYGCMDEAGARNMFQPNETALRAI